MRYFMETLKSLEEASGLEYSTYVKTLINYKEEEGREFERRKKENPSEPDPIPHPDDIVFNSSTGVVELYGPMTKQEQVLWDRIEESEAAIGELEGLLAQDRDDEPRLHYPPAGSARADGGCARLSALTAGVRVASCKRRRGRRPGVKKVPDRGLTSARARGNAPSAKTEIAESWYCSRSPAYAGTACATSITRARSTQSYFRRAHDQDRAIRKIKRETRSLVASGASLSTRSGGGRRVELLEKAFERTQPRFLARLPP